tara:strand:- start:666 stop:848 length:183 start_codon:yes stop_codon:yes gene_type:complete
MTYYQSAKQTPITYQRAMKELQRHGLDTEQSIEDFNAECWSKYQKSETIQARRVLDWLGY